MFSNFAQIFHDGILYYRVEMENGSHFISSKREKLKLKDLEDRGIRFPTFIQNYQEHPYSCLKNKPWSSDSIENFLKGNQSQKTVDPQKLFLRVKNIIRKFPHPEDENELLLLTLFPFQTGLYSVFQTTLYLSLVGDPYLRQMFLELAEKICFNGIRLNSPSSSLISRIVCLCGGTVVITTHHDHLGNHSFNNILGVLEEGCRSSGSFYVLNECGLPIPLPVHSPKILDVEPRGKYLKNLIIEIQVEKQPEPPFYFHMTETEQELQKLRDDLHICCLENVNDISNIYQKIDTVPGISNQWMEFLSGIFSIAKHLDTFFEAPFLFESVVSWAKEMTSRFKHDQKFDDKNKHIIHLVSEFIQRFEPNIDGYYVAEDIARYVNEAGDLSKKLRPEDITRRLKHFDPKRKRDWVDVGPKEDKKQRTKIKFDYDKLLKQVNA